MMFEDFKKRNNFNKDELLACSNSNLIEDTPAEGLPTLPAPPFLMFDRITAIEHSGHQGRIKAEQDIKIDAWFFQCHFRNDPVQPGCLGVDAIWQLLGFYCATRGAKGSGRALGSKEIEFFGQIRPHNKIVTYDIKIRRYSEFTDNECAIVVGSGDVYVDQEHIYTVKDAKVGIFKDIRYANYPWQSEHSKGGKLQR